MTTADDYRGSVAGLDEFGPQLCGMIEGWLQHHGIDVHSVSHRVKAVESASLKVADRDKYTGFSDLTDLLGVRVVTYFAEDVDRVAEVVVPELVIDTENSVDKRAILDPDRFGYLSLHYIATLGPSRAGLVEYMRFDGVRFELQIRSILQHAWAEIEHDLGYKSKSAVPKELRRRFSRLAGLLEVADDEFERMRADAQRIAAEEEREMAAAPKSVRLRQSSVLSMIARDENVAHLDNRIAEMCNRPLDVEPSPDYADSRARTLSELGVRDVSSLREMLSARGDDVVALARLWMGPAKAGGHRTLPRGISLFYLVYLLMVESDVAPESLRVKDRDDLLRRLKTVWQERAPRSRRTGTSSTPESDPPH